MRRLVLLMLVAATGAAGACAAPAETPSSVSTPTSSTPSVGHGSLAYCLNRHGVASGPGPMPGPPPGVDAAKWHQAMAACSSLAPGPAS